MVEIREQLVAALQAHDVCVVSGETGSGKTTQVRVGSFSAQWAEWCSCRVCVSMRIVSGETGSGKTPRCVWGQGC